MKERLQALGRECKENAKLRLGIWIILGIFGGYLCLTLHDVNKVMRNTCIRLCDKRIRLENLTHGQGKVWRQRLTTAKKAYLEERKHFPVIHNEGLARADVENQLSDILSRAGVENGRLHMDQLNALSDLAGIRQLPVRIEGVFAPAVLIRLLYALETLPQRGEVKQLTISRGRNPRFEIVYALYFLQLSDKKTGS